MKIRVQVGAVAQLGERLNGIQEVRGSIPLGSIRMKQSGGVAEWLMAADCKSAGLRPT